MQRRAVTIICWLLALAAGGLEARAALYDFDPDTISYLDMADAYLRGDWPMALNGCWNPLYTWLLCLLQLFATPSPYWEFPAVRWFNFGIYAAGLPCIHFLLLKLSSFNARLGALPSLKDTVIVPERALLALGYLLYVWTSLDLIGLHEGADLCLANLVYLAFGLLFWIGTEPKNWKPFAFLGLVLGLGYLTKSVMLPLTGVFLAIGLWLTADVRKALPRGILALLIFFLVAGPFIAALSQAKDRLTFSDTGRVNYGIYVCMGADGRWIPPYFPWQGGVADCGTPIHPIRALHAASTVYEFGTPFQATYGAWYDPTYWYDGIVPRLDARNQARVLMRSAETYLKVLSGQPALVAGLAILAWMGWVSRRRFDALASLRIFLVPVVAAFSIYGVVHTESRYVGAYVTLLWLCLYAGVRLKDSLESRSLVLGVVVSVVIATFLSTILPQSLTDLQTIRRGDGAANHSSVRIAKGLNELGIKSGDKIATIGYGFDDSQWARTARVHIVAQITPNDSSDYWNADQMARDRVRSVIAGTGAVAIVTQSPPRDRPADWDARWKRVEYIYVSVLEN